MLRQLRASSRWARAQSPSGSLWFPGLAVALALTWQVTRSWTEALIALNIASFLLQCYWPEWEDNGVLTSKALSGSAHQLVSSTFLHASWYHLGVNMYSLMYMGRTAERAFGAGRFLFLFLGSAIASSLCSAWLKQRSQGPPSVGASGGVFGIMAALLVYRWRHGLPYQQLLMVLAANFVLGFTSRQVDNAGHAGGIAAGAAIAYLWGPRFVWALGGLIMKDAPIISWPFV